MERRVTANVESEPIVSTWPEIESRVHRPGLWVAIIVGVVFSITGGLIVVAPEPAAAEAGNFIWVRPAFGGVFAFLGLVAVAAAAIGSIPAYIRHADSSVLPSVPREPIVQEGSILKGALTHELAKCDDGWEFRPRRAMRQAVKTFVLSFGAPFLLISFGSITWLIHGHHKVNVVTAAALASVVTVLCGGTPVLLIGLMLRNAAQSLASLTIPQTGDQLHLEVPEAPAHPFTDWRRKPIQLARRDVVAVQLCPLYFVFGSDKTTVWGVQGLLVGATSLQQHYERIPILLTGDFIGAARLMQRLADQLDVPYLFGADKDGWDEERLRAQKRPPLKTGGTC